MELIYDWRSFQSVFDSHVPGSRGSRANSRCAPIYAVVENGIVISALGEGQALASWNGATYKELASGFPGKKVLAFERSQVDQWMRDSLSMPHFHEQTEHLKIVASTPGFSKKRPPDHFLLKALQGKWKKILPFNYGIFIRIEGETTQDLFLTVRGGKLESFQEPDFSGEFSRAPSDLVRFLTDAHRIPVQGIFVSPEEWASWRESARPWRQVMRAFKAKRARLVPFRWWAAALAAGKAVW